MASVLEPTGVMPSGSPRAIPAPYAGWPTVSPGNPSVPIDDDAYEPIAAVAREMARALDADGLLVAWHDRDGAAMTLYAAGACEAQTPVAEMAMCAAAVRDGAPHSDWAALDNGGGGLLTTTIPAGSGVVTVAALFHRIGEGTRAHARETAARLLPLVQPFFAMWSARLRTLARMRGLTEAANKGEVGILLVNAGGHLLFVNAAAQALIERHDGLRRNGALLSGSRLSDTLRLQAAIEHVVGSGGGGSDSARAPAPVVAVNRRDRRPLLVAIVACEQGATGSDDCAAILYVFDPEHDLRPSVEPACKLYGLSPVETRLTCLLSDGISLADAAVTMHVREQTARSYLKQVFLKTETNRQAELVWLMLKSSVRTAPDCRTSFV